MGHEQKSAKTFDSYLVLGIMITLLVFKLFPAFLLLLAGDVELNPGPTLSQTIVTPIKLEIPSEM